MNKTLILLFLLISCNRYHNADLEKVGNSVKEIYSIDSFDFVLTPRIISIEFPVDSCQFYLYELSNLKSYLAIENIKDSMFFDRIDTVFLITYIEGNRETMVVNYFTKSNLQHHKSMKSSKKVLAVAKYINSHMTCSWLAEANAYISTYNKSYQKATQVPKYHNMIELLTLAAQDSHLESSIHIISLEYINGVIKERKSEWPDYGNHVDSILNIISAPRRPGS